MNASEQVGMTKISVAVEENSIINTCSFDNKTQLYIIDI